MRDVYALVYNRPIPSVTLKVINHAIEHRKTTNRASIRNQYLGAMGILRAPTAAGDISALHSKFGMLHPYVLQIANMIEYFKIS